MCIKSFNSLSLLNILSKRMNMLDFFSLVICHIHKSYVPYIKIFSLFTFCNNLGLLEPHLFCFTALLPTVPLFLFCHSSKNAQKPGFPFLYTSGLYSTNKMIQSDTLPMYNHILKIFLIAPDNLQLTYRKDRKKHIGFKSLTVFNS